MCIRDSLTFSTRLFNLLVTNVPGPQMPLYVLGHKLEETFPVAFLAKNHALAVGVMSYNGQFNFGFLGDYDAMPDLKDISSGIRVALDELLEAAKECKGRARPSPHAPRTWFRCPG